MRSRLVELAERYALAACALLLALLLKLHYSEASPEALRWVLAPTAGMVALLTGREFSFQTGEGYLSRELSILISPACAGVNFLIVALLSLTVGFGGRFHGLRQRAEWLVAAAAIAYVTTLLMNALRITLSVALAHLAAHELGLTFQSVHRLIGIVVYVAGLVGLCLTVRMCLRSRRPTFGRAEEVLIALGCYITITLLVPALRGAASEPGYFRHAVPVSVLVGGLAALLFAARGRTWDDGRHEFRSAECSQPEPSAHQPGTRG